MSYQSLARKYRPTKFADMVGQESVTEALENAIRLGREPQSVVFSGVRGVGKTTTARLYAKALNCEVEGITDPCNACASCLAINEGVHEDVLEIDGASHTGVEDIRSLQETLSYVPQRSRYKVYIIDEVHMLSNSAFNALLKSIEEPPAHVVFIFATTELQKVPDTIISRCQTFHLRHISLESIVSRIETILDHENVTYESHALAIVAQQGRGSLRDSLTFLDQVIALGQGSVTSETVGSIVNAASTETYIAFIEKLIEKDAAVLVDIIASWVAQGVSLKSTVTNLAKYTRHGFVIKSLGAKALDAKLLGLSPNELDMLTKLSEKAATLNLNQIFRLLLQTVDDLDDSELDQFILENMAFEWCLDPGFPDIQQLKSALLDKSKIPQPDLTGVSRAVSLESSKPATAQTSDKPKLSLKERWSKSSAVASKAVTESESTTKIETTQKVDAPQNAETTPQPHKSLFPQEPTHAEAKQGNPEQINAAIAPMSPAPVNEAPPMATGDTSKPEVEISKKILPEEGDSLQEIAVSAKPLEGTNQGAEEAIDSDLKFPDSWKQLVTIWMKLEPLQGRILEETVPLEFGQDLIKVAVRPESLGGSKLLSLEYRSKVISSLRERFSFAGEFVVEERADPATVQALSNDDEQQKSLLEIRQKEKEEKRKQEENEIRSHPLTMELLNEFNGKITTVEFEDHPI
ncbi:MAG: DNA polymerase III subunit gamma/tau [Pseudobacteriovorax sp.]|nr:DNA polymerase III subunit gamma/tau [Pseudobacteriovorax sp.]